jgi:hypothetical protein
MSSASRERMSSSNKNLKPKLSLNQKNLIRRYLMWCYKTAKEDLDRVDRYYTQLTVDQIVLTSLKASAGFKARQEIRKKIEEFEQYMAKKKAGVDLKKFINEPQTYGAVGERKFDGRINPSQPQLTPHYEYTKLRFEAIENAIRFFLGDQALRSICRQYETEMARRIFESGEHT